MKDTCYIIVNTKGFVKATKTPGVVKPGEIRIKLDIKIPDEYFRRPMFEGTIEVPEGKYDEKIVELEFELKKIKGETETNV